MSVYLLNLRGALGFSGFGPSNRFSRLRLGCSWRRLGSGWLGSGWLVGGRSSRLGGRVGIGSERVTDHGHNVLLRVLESSCAHQETKGDVKMSVCITPCVHAAYVLIIYLKVEYSTVVCQEWDSNHIQYTFHQFIKMISQAESL